MRKLPYLLFLALAAIFNVCCEKSASEEFNDANGFVVSKLLQIISVADSEEPYEEENILFFYDDNNRLIEFTGDGYKNLFVYKNGNLSNIVGQSVVGNAEELYKSPYDAFRYGDVKEWDDSGNPVLIEFYDDNENNANPDEAYTAEISYDDKPNLFYYTLKSAGLIEVMDRVQFAVGILPPPHEIIRARALLPVNNMKNIIYRNENGLIEYEIAIDYTYNKLGYPSYATISGKDSKNSSVLQVNFQYLE